MGLKAGKLRNPSHFDPRPVFGLLCLGSGFRAGVFHQALGLALVLLQPASATVAQAETRLTWLCAASDGQAAQQVELVYAGPDVVPCKAYLVRPGAANRLIADYDATRGQCERYVRQMLSSLVAGGHSCDEPEGATLLGVEARARGDVPDRAATAGAPSVPTAPSAPAAPAVPIAPGDLYFAIISKQNNQAAARAEVARLRASDSSVRPVILSPREKGGRWLVALAAYTDAETAAKAVQFARQSGIGPDAYFWNIPRSLASEEMLGGNQ
jgi:hypothetical protein